MVQHIRRTETIERWERKGLSLSIGLLLFFPLLPLIACGGGGGGNGPTRPGGGVRFASQPLPATAAVHLGLDSASNENRVFLELRASNVEDFSAVSINLNFPGQLLRFAGASPGNFWGPSTDLNTMESDSFASVFVGAREGEAVETWQGVSGSGVLARLEFEVVAGGTGGFGETFFRAAGPGNMTLDVAWVPGQITIQR